MNYRIEFSNEPRESFGNYRYEIFKDGQLVAYLWHDYRGDDYGIEFVGGGGKDWPIGRLTNFLAGGGPKPLRLSTKAIEYLDEELNG